MDQQRGEATVLVVDDEPNILELLSAALRLSGFTVHAADCGAEALATARRVRPDIVVLDVLLPDTDGFSLARSLRAVHDRLPVLFLTARDAVEDRIAGLTAGGDDYVTKPFSLEEVVLRLWAILRRTGGGTDSRRTTAPSGTPISCSTRTPTRSTGPAGWSSSRRRSSTCCGT